MRKLDEMETERLADLKCRDCDHCRLSVLWDPQRVCEIVGFPVDKDGPACISVLPKLSAPGPSLFEKTVSLQKSDSLCQTKQNRPNQRKRDGNHNGPMPRWK